MPKASAQVKYQPKGYLTTTPETEPETVASSVSLNVKCSMAYREASGEGGLCDGGVGSDVEGAAADIRASSEEELGPSKTR